MTLCCALAVLRALPHFQEQEAGRDLRRAGGSAAPPVAQMSCAICSAAPYACSTHVHLVHACVWMSLATKANSACRTRRRNRNRKTSATITRHRHVPVQQSKHCDDCCFPSLTCHLRRAHQQAVYNLCINAMLPKLHAGVMGGNTSTATNHPVSQSAARSIGQHVCQPP